MDINLALNIAGITIGIIGLIFVGNKIIKKYKTRTKLKGDSNQVVSIEGENNNVHLNISGEQLGNKSRYVTPRKENQLFKEYHKCQKCGYGYRLSPLILNNPYVNIASSDFTIDCPKCGNVDNI